MADKMSAVDRLQMKRSIIDLMCEFLATIRSTTTFPRRDKMKTAPYATPKDVSMGMLKFKLQSCMANEDLKKITENDNIQVDVSAGITRREKLLKCKKETAWKDV